MNWRERNGKRISRKSRKGSGGVYAKTREEERERIILRGKAGRGSGGIKDSH